MMFMMTIANVFLKQDLLKQDLLGYKTPFVTQLYVTRIFIVKELFSSERNVSF